MTGLNGRPGERGGAWSRSGRPVDTILDEEDSPQGPNPKGEVGEADSLLLHRSTKEARSKKKTKQAPSGGRKRARRWAQPSAQRRGEAMLHKAGLWARGAGTNGSNGDIGSGPRHRSNEMCLGALGSATMKTLKTCACFLGQRASVMSRLVSAHEGLHASTEMLSSIFGNWSN